MSFFDELFAAYGIPADDDHRKNAVSSLFPRLASSVPIIPLRASPKRTYDPFHEFAAAEGSGLPMVILRLMDRTDKEHSKLLHDSLVKFGQGSGMFSNIKVSRQGKHILDPLQLQVKDRSGQLRNIKDVGYGVSQSCQLLLTCWPQKSRLESATGVIALS